MISHDGISFNPPTSSSSINGFLQENSFPPPNPNPNPNPDTNVNKRKRSLPGNPDPEADVIALSPRSLMATNRFICEVCNKGFQREQNLQLHRRGHNLPWKLKQKSNKEPVRKKVYICPEKSCVHHDASRALGDLTGIKKHYSRKHGEKKWKCDKCSKKYAVMSDWKAHSKICGTREYKCDCGTIFSRKDSFITHRAFCDALTEERMRVNTSINPSVLNQNFRADFMSGSLISTPQSIAGVSPFSTSHRPEFVGFEHASSNANSMVDHLNKPRLPLWLDHHSTNSQVMDNHIDLSNSSNNNNNNASSSFFPEFSIPHETIPKEESNGNKSGYPQSLISLYSSQPLPCSASQGSMSATALLQKAAQIGSTRSDSNSTVFANAFGSIRSPSSSSAPSNSLTNFDGGLQQPKHLYGQNSMSNQLGIEQGYSETEQLMMMGEALSESSNKMSSSAGMRDFLGTLGGVAGNNNAWS